MCIICIIYARIYIIFENDLSFSRVKSKHCHFESQIWIGSDLQFIIFIQVNFQPRSMNGCVLISENSN